MSGDAEQEYFSDGISEDIITDLSKVSALHVVSRNTAFTFKGKAVDVAPGRQSTQRQPCCWKEACAKRPGGSGLPRN